MKWPERPTCHGSSGADWRPAELDPLRECDCGYKSLGPYGYPFRTCSYDGSISAEDLAYYLQHGARLGGSDWKYQFPHKFYVEDIANPLAGKMVDISSSSHGFDHVPTSAEINEDVARFQSSVQGEVFVRTRANEIRPGFYTVELHGRSEAPVHTFAKFYTAHLEDAGYDEEAHDLILRLVSERSGIHFTRAGNSPIKGRGFAVNYLAPYFGYQKD